MQIQLKPFRIYATDGSFAATRTGRAFATLDQACRFAASLFDCQAEVRDERIRFPASKVVALYNLGKCSFKLEVGFEFEFESKSEPKMEPKPEFKVPQVLEPVKYERKPTVTVKTKVALGNPSHNNKKRPKEALNSNLASRDKLSVLCKIINNRLHRV